MNTETQHAPSIQDIIREETQNGKLIVQFLVSVIRGEIRDTTAWHQLDATRQLGRLGFVDARLLESLRANPAKAPHESVRADRVLSPSKGPVEAPAIDTADADPAPVRADRVLSPSKGPVEAPAHDTNGAALRSLPQSAGAAVPPLPQGEGRGEGETTAEEPALNGVEWPGGAPPVDTAGLNPDLARFIRTETDGGRKVIRFFVDVMLGFLPMFKPHLRMDAAKELMRRGFDGPAPTAPVRADRVLSSSKGPVEASHEAVRAEPVEAPAPDTNGTGPSIRHSGIPATAGTGEEAGIQRGGDTPPTNADPESVRADRVLSPSKGPAEAPTPDANGASFHPLPQGEGQGEGDALDYEPPYVNTYGHSEDDGFNTRAVFKAADALMDAVGRLPQTPADIEAARRSRKHSIIVHNGNEHYFSECSRGAVESAIATREVMEAIRRIRDSCRTPSAFEPVDDAHKSVRAEPVEAPHESVGAVREPPNPAPDQDANGAAQSPSFRRRPEPRGGDASAIDPVRAEPVEAPAPESPFP